MLFRLNQVTHVLRIIKLLLYSRPKYIITLPRYLLRRETTPKPYIIYIHMYLFDQLRQASGSSNGHISFRVLQVKHIPQFSSLLVETTFVSLWYMQSKRVKQSDWTNILYNYQHNFCNSKNFQTNLKYMEYKLDQLRRRNLDFFVKTELVF